MEVKIKCHYNLDSQDVAKYNKNPQVVLDLTDYKGKRKLLKVIKQLRGDDDNVRDPIKGDNIKLAVSKDVKYYKGDDRVIISKLKGHEVTAVIKLKRYKFKSMLASNKGDEVEGISGTLISLKSDF